MKKKKASEDLITARITAENRAFDYVCEFVVTLEEFYYTTKPIVRKRNRKLPTLKELYDKKSLVDEELDFVTEIENSGYFIYGEDAYGFLKECTSCAIELLRKRAKRIGYWNEKILALEEKFYEVQAAEYRAEHAE